jgi:hypothetical protein
MRNIIWHFLGFITKPKMQDTLFSSTNNIYSVKVLSDILCKMKSAYSIIIVNINSQ